MARAEQQTTAFSPHLLTRLVSNKHLAETESFKNNDHGEVELTLGLSLNARFGTVPTAKNDNYTRSLKRSSSISDFTLTHQSRHVSHALGRTCSLPVETEEWRRRKEIQSLRRLEAKRKRSEKQRNSSSSSSSSINNNSSRVTRLMVEAPVFVGSVPKDVVLPSQLSAASDSLTAQGSSEPSVHSALPPESDRGGNLNASASRKVLEEMPCVSTTGVGPNGKRVEGFLYRYTKGDQLRIVCVCHGSLCLRPSLSNMPAGAGWLSLLSILLLIPFPRCNFSSTFVFSHSNKIKRVSWVSLGLFIYPLFMCI